MVTSNDHQKELRIGEVVETSSMEFTAQCYELYTSPPLGALVRCNQTDPVYGVVSEISTRSMDPSRHPIARGAEEPTEEDVYLSNPQLTRLLNTEFKVILVGHQSDGQIIRFLGPIPPKVHAFVYHCSDDETREFCDSLEFIQVLLTSSVASPDDVTASFIRQSSSYFTNPKDFLIASGRELALILSQDTRRLNGLLKRLSV